jgi:hypothetical protein
MEKWKIGLFAGFLGIIAFFLPVWSLSASGAGMSTTTVYWYFGLTITFISYWGNTLYYEINLLTFISGIMTLSITIISIAMANRSKTSDMNANLWIILGVLLLVIPLLGYIV